MKKTDLEKLKGLKIAGNMKQAAVPGRFGKDASVMVDKREQRRRDQEAGLVPFAVKLPLDLVTRLRAQADAAGKNLNEFTAETLANGLDRK